MTEDRMPLSELLQKAGDGDFLRAVAESVLQILMETDVEGLIGAGRHERSAERLNWRNGYRERTLDTRLGSLNLKIPKLRQGSYFPPFLEARKTTEKAQFSIVRSLRGLSILFRRRPPFPKCSPPQRDAATPPASAADTDSVWHSGV